MYKNFQKSIDINAFKVSVKTFICTVTFTKKNSEYISKLDKMQKMANYLSVDVSYLYGSEESSIDKENTNNQ